MNPHLQEQEITTEETPLSPPGSDGTTERENRLQNEALASFFAGLVKKPGPQTPPVKQTTSPQLEAARMAEKLKKSEQVILSLKDRVNYLAETVETGIIGKQKDMLDELEWENKTLHIEVCEARLEVAKLRSEKAELQRELVNKELEASRLTNKLRVANNLNDNEAKAIRHAVKDNPVKSTKEQLQRTVTAQAVLAKVQAIKARMELEVTLDVLVERRKFLEEAVREKSDRLQSLQADLELAKPDAPTVHETTHGPTTPDEADVRAVRENLCTDVKDEINQKFEAIKIQLADMRGMVQAMVVTQEMTTRDLTQSRQVQKLQQDIATSDETTTSHSSDN